VPIVVALKVSEHETSARVVANALARRLKTQALTIERDELAVLEARTRELDPLLLVASETSLTQRLRLLREVSCPVLYTPPDAELPAVLAEGRPLRVMLALEHTAKADEPVIRVARSLRSALSCELTLLCGESTGESVVHTLASQESYDLAILGIKSLEMASNVAISKPLIVVAQTSARADASTPTTQRARESAH